MVSYSGVTGLSLEMRKTRKALAREYDEHPIKHFLAVTLRTAELNMSLQWFFHCFYFNNCSYCQSENIPNQMFLWMQIWNRFYSIDVKSFFNNY